MSPSINFFICKYSVIYSVKKSIEFSRFSLAHYSTYSSRCVGILLNGKLLTKQGTGFL